MPNPKPRVSLQSLATILAQNLSALSKHVSAHADLLDSTVVYPLPQFPGATEADLLSQLLRKKLQPGAEDFVEKGRATGAELLASGTAEQLKELWQWAGPSINAEARAREWDSEFTLEEKESGTSNVVTGLKRSLEESSDEEDEDEDEEMGDAPKAGEMSVVGVRRKDSQAGLEFEVAEAKRDARGPEPLTLEQVLRFSCTGIDKR